MSIRTNVGERKKTPSDSNLAERSNLPEAMEAGVKLKMPATLLGHVTRSQATLEGLRKSGGVEGVIRDAFKKYEHDLSRLKQACDQVTPIGVVQEAAKEAWMMRNVESKEKYLKAMKNVFEEENPRLQLNDEDVERESMRSARSGPPSVTSATGSAKREAAAKTRALELEVEHRRKQRQLEEQERQLRLQREDQELQLRLQQARIMEEALEDDEHASDRAESIRGPLGDVEDVQAGVFAPPGSSWVPPAQGRPFEFNAAEGLLQQVLLPPSTLPVFKGEHLDFMWFLKTFEMRVETVTFDPARRLYLLLQHLEGDPKTLVMGCQLVEDPAVGYARAKEKLVNKYGNKIRQALAFKSKLLAWPTLKKDSTQDLERFSIQLQLCEDVKLAGGLAELDAAGTLVQLMNKLPRKLQESWQMRAYKIECHQRREANFEDFNRFIGDLAAARTHPVYGGRIEAKTDAPKKQARTLMTSVIEDEVQSALTSAKSGHSEAESSGSTKVVNAFKAPCLFCEGNHAGEKCRSAKSMTLKEKRTKLEGLCFACLQQGHTARQCPKRAVCGQCKGSHPTVLHFEKPMKQDLTTNSHDNKEKGETQTQAATSCVAVSTMKVAVAVVPLKIWFGRAQPVIVTAVLDPGSTATFITNRLVRTMGLDAADSSLNLTTMSSSRQEIATKVVPGVKVSGLDQNEVITLPPMYTVDSMPYSKNDVVKEEDVIHFKHLSDVPFNWHDAEVEMLIGMNAPEALKPLEVIGGRGHEPYAVKTALGWCLNGPIGPGYKEKARATVNLTKVTELKVLLDKLHSSTFEDAYNFDEKGPSQEDNQWLNMVQASICRSPEDKTRFEIALPFRERPPPLVDNKDQATRRLNSLKRKFALNQQFHQDYADFMDQMEAKKYVERVDDMDLLKSKGQNVVSYVLHHGVYHPRKPGKLRVVFDCSSKYQGRSVNDCLIPGPDLTSSLLGVLIRFRQEAVAFTADIEAMFYQVRVPCVDRDTLRYLWWPGGDVTKPPSTYRMKVHLFGAASSPSCSNFALRQAAEEAQAAGRIPTDVCQAVKRNFYVDDCLKSVPTDDEAINMAEGLVNACAWGGFRLTKFVSTSVKVLQSMHPQERAKEIQSVDLSANKEDPLGALQERALGVLWSVQKDSFQIVKPGPKTHASETTKRSVLSTLSSLYDPMGIAAPVIIVARIMFRELTKDQALRWDDILTANRPELEQKWRTWVEELAQLHTVNVPRCYRPQGEQRASQTEDWQLHVFCDASEDAYAAVAYLRQWQPASQSAHVIFVMGKARVTPPKVVTIPRLELTAAKLATEVASLVQRELQYPIQQRVLWTDSQTVLKYLHNRVRRFHTFVANRVSSILSSSALVEWRHVPTEENPADEGTRGLKAIDLADSMWLTGPTFLRKDNQYWPTMEKAKDVSDNDPEVRATATNAQQQVELKSQPNLVECWAQRHSTFFQLKKAVRVWRSFIAYAGRGVTAWAPRPETRVKELHEAERAIVRAVQWHQWPEEVKSLEERKWLPKSSPLFKLSPARLGDGMVVVRSRLKEQLPIIPGSSKIAELIVREAHVERAHLGRQATSARVLNKYWIVGLNKLVRRVLRECPSCQRRLSQPKTPEMADLPQYRVRNESGRAFETTGVDYFGPFLVKRGRTTVKMYGVIFTCSTTRAVHLEVAEDLSSSAFINALRRFIARRGHVRRLVSDNGTNFAGAETLMAEELRKELQKRETKTMVKWLETKSIEWVFNPPGASHHGGFWERLIRSVRQILGALIQRPLTYDGMTTVLCEVESILNNRPLTTTSDDPDDLEPLTPNHLLLGREGPAAPPGDFRRGAIPLKRQWRQVQHIASSFWRRWMTEYRVLLHQRPKWHTDGGRMLELNDVVLVVDAVKPREYWALGKIVALHPGKDNKVRVVTVKTTKGTLKRPVTKLCLLEAASASHKTHT